MSAVVLPLVLLCLVPAVCWLVGGGAVAARRWYRRRGTLEQRRARLTRLLGERDLVLVPTSDIDLAEADVLAVAAAHGFRLLGYEPSGFLRRRSGVFVRTGGGVGRMLAGSPAQPSSTVRLAQR